MFIHSMTNAAIHFGGGLAMGVLTVFAAAGVLGMMAGDRNRASLGANGRGFNASSRSAASGGSSMSEGI